MYRNHSWFHDNPLGDPLGFGKYQDPSLIGLIGTGVGAIVGAQGARGAASDLTGAAARAGQTQTDLTQRAIDQQNLTSGLAGQLINPQRISGNYAQQALASALGLPQTALPGITLPGGGQLAGTQALGAATPGSPLATAFTPFSYGADQFKESPGYQFALQQGLNTIQQNAAAKGMLLSPNTIKDLEGYATGLASQDYQQQYQNAYQAYTQNQANVLNALNAQAGQGTLAGTNLAGALGTAGGNISNLLSGLGGSLAGTQLGAGSAAAAGRVGATNALTSGLSNLSNLTTAGRLLGGQGGYGGFGDLISGVSPGLAGGLGDMLGMSIGGTYGPATQAGLDALISSFSGGSGAAAGAGAAGAGAAGAGTGAAGATGAEAAGAGASGLGGVAALTAAPFALAIGGMLGGLLGYSDQGTPFTNANEAWANLLQQNPSLANQYGTGNVNQFMQSLYGPVPQTGFYSNDQYQAAQQQLGQMSAALPNNRGVGWWMGGSPDN